MSRKIIITAEFDEEEFIDKDHFIEVTDAIKMTLLEDCGAITVNVVEEE